MEDRVQLLIEILFDSTAREDERDDAAMDLGDYKDPRALRALEKIASDPEEDTMILDSCGESIGDICSAMNFFDQVSFKKMIPSIQKQVFGIIMARNPDLIDKGLQEELSKKFDLEK